MAATNRQFAVPDFEPQTTQPVYPELQPVHSPQRHPLQSRQKKRMTRGEGLFYLAVNIALVFGVLQCVRTFVGDSLNLMSLFHSQASVQKYHQQTVHEQQQLKERIRIYSSASGIEELARNYLDMVGEHELPIRFQ
jgi:cell division protein FtsB